MSKTAITMVENEITIEGTGENIFTLVCNLVLEIERRSGNTQDTRKDKVDKAFDAGYAQVCPKCKFENTVVLEQCGAKTISYGDIKGRIVKCVGCAAQNKVEVFDKCNTITASDVREPFLRHSVLNQETGRAFFTYGDARTQEIDNYWLIDKLNTKALFEYMSGYDGVITSRCAANLLMTGTTEPVKYVCVNCGKIQPINNVDASCQNCHYCECEHDVCWENYPNVVAKPYEDYQTHYNNKTDMLTCEHLQRGITEDIESYSSIKNPNILELLKRLTDKSKCSERWVMPSGLAEHIIKQPKDTQEKPEKEADLTSTGDELLGLIKKLIKRAMNET